MTIKEAVRKARERQAWGVTPHEPASVAVLFADKSGQWYETELDLYADDKETELAGLWESLCGEMGSAADLVVEVKACGYITK